MYVLIWLLAGMVKYKERYSFEETNSTFHDPFEYNYSLAIVVFMSKPYFITLQQNKPRLDKQIVDAKETNVCYNKSLQYSLSLSKPTTALAPALIFCESKI